MHGPTANYTGPAERTKRHDDAGGVSCRAWYVRSAQRRPRLNRPLHCRQHERPHLPCLHRGANPHSDAPPCWSGPLFVSECWARLACIFSPTPDPTLAPSFGPSMLPSTSPTLAPSTFSPSLYPLQGSLPPSSAMPSPSSTLSLLPTIQPSAVPSSLPTKSPSLDPTGASSAIPTLQPSLAPTSAPSRTTAPSWPDAPKSSAATLEPSWQQSSVPTLRPTSMPSVVPTLEPTLFRAALPVATSWPSLEPTVTPTLVPTLEPSTRPTLSPSLLSELESKRPTQGPSAFPTKAPTLQPSLEPSPTPTLNPSLAPSPTADYSDTTDIFFVVTETSKLSGLPFRVDDFRIFQFDVSKQFSTTRNRLQLLSASRTEFGARIVGRLLSTVAFMVLVAQSPGRSHSHRVASSRMTSTRTLLTFACLGLGCAEFRLAW